MVALVASDPLHPTHTQFPMGVPPLTLPGEPGPVGPTGPEGPPGTGAVAVAFVFSQDIPAAIWNIEHNMNTCPDVTIVDSTSSQVFGDVFYPDLNNVRLVFGSAFSGKAYLI